MNYGFSSPHRAPPRCKCSAKTVLIQERLKLAFYYLIVYTFTMSDQNEEKGFKMRGTGVSSSNVIVSDRLLDYGDFVSSTSQKAASVKTVQSAKTVQSTKPVQSTKAVQSTKPLQTQSDETEVLEKKEAVVTKNKRENKIFQ